MSNAANEQQQKKENETKEETKKEDPKVLVLVISSTIFPIYLDHIRTWREHMIRAAPPSNVRVLLIAGDSSLPANGPPWRLIADQHVLLLRCDESFVPGILQKTLLALQWYFAEGLDKEYPFVLRTNLSSFWVWRNLLPAIRERFCDKITEQEQEPKTTTGAIVPKKLVYAGVVGSYESRIKFCSGAGFIVSADTARLLVEAMPQLFVDPLPDDVAVGQFLILQKGLTPQQMDRFDMTEYGVVYKAIPEDHLHRVYHYRVNSHWNAQARAETDMANMKTLVATYCPP